jgi:hypothetical protein
MVPPRICASGPSLVKGNANGPSARCRRPTFVLLRPPRDALRAGVWESGEIEHREVARGREA